MSEYIWIETDNAIRIRGLADLVSGEYINDATVTAALYDANGNLVAGAEDIALTYVFGSDGDYAGEIPNSVQLNEGRTYTIRIAITGNGYKTTYKINRQAAFKGS